MGDGVGRRPGGRARSGAARLVRRRVAAARPAGAPLGRAAAGAGRRRQARRWWPHRLGRCAGALDSAGRRCPTPGTAWRPWSRRCSPACGRSTAPHGSTASPVSEAPVLEVLTGADAGDGRRDRWRPSPPARGRPTGLTGTARSGANRTGVCRNWRFPCCTRILTAPLHCLGSPRTPETVVGCVITSATARPGSPAVVMGRKVWRRFWPRNESSATTKISSGSTSPTSVSTRC